MIYILEGNECNFKTTVSEKLSGLTGFPIIKGSSFELSQCTNEELFDKFVEFASMDNVILDRFIYSNLVYATLYEDYSIITGDQARYIEEMIKNKALIVYLHAEDQVIINRISIRGDDYVAIDRVAAINSKYTDVMNGVTRVNTIKFDTAIYSSNDIVIELSRGAVK